MKRLAAQYIFPISQPPIRKGLLEIDEQGKILHIESAGKEFRELPAMEYYNGILCPGILNPFDFFEETELIRFYPELLPYFSFIRGSRANLLQLWEWIRMIALKGQYSLEDLLAVFCLRTAKLTGQDREKGSLETGKTPGLCLISPVNLQLLQLRPDSRLKKLTE